MPPSLESGETRRRDVSSSRALLRSERLFLRVVVVSVPLCVLRLLLFLFVSKKECAQPAKERERDARARMLESTQARKFRTKTKRRACFQSSMVDALCRASSPSCSRGVFLSRERPTDAREREGGNEGVFEVFVRVYIYNARKEESLRCVYCARACR